MRHCDNCVFFKPDWTPGDSWCTEEYDICFDDMSNPPYDPSDVRCTAWKSLKRWGEIYKRNGEIQTLKAMHRMIASLLAIGSENALRHAAAIAKEHGGEA